MASRDLVIRWAPIPETPQEAFFDDDTPDANLLFRGGWGSGKTMTVTAKALKLSAINAPLPGIWTVPDYAHIRDTILPMLEEPDSDRVDPVPGVEKYRRARAACRREAAPEGGGRDQRGPRLARGDVRPRSG